MNYGLLMNRADAERRIRELHAAGYKIRDLSSLFSLHPLIVQRIVQQELDKPAEIGQKLGNGQSII